MTADSPPAVTRSIEGITEIEISRISPNPFQPRQRMDEQELEDLAASIRSTGILQPILVRRMSEGYQLIVGERRWRAAQRAGVERIPALIRDVPDERLLEVALIENIQRQELNPIDEARAYSALQRIQGMSSAEIADKVGKQRSSVANSMRLLKLASSVLARVEKGTVSMGHARALLGLLDPSKQESMAQAIENKGLNVRQTEALVRRLNEPPKQTAAPSRRDPNVVAAEDELGRKLGTKVRIEQGKAGRGRILIEFYSDDELERIYESITNSSTKS